MSKYSAWVYGLFHCKIQGLHYGVPQQIILDIWRLQVSQLHFWVRNVVFMYALLQGLGRFQTCFNFKENENHTRVELNVKDNYLSSWRRTSELMALGTGWSSRLIIFTLEVISLHFSWICSMFQSWPQARTANGISSKPPALPTKEQVLAVSSSSLLSKAQSDWMDSDQYSP